MKKKAFTIAALALAGACAAAFAGVGVPEPARGEAAAVRTITVTGEGVVEARPDEAAFSFGVDSRAPTAREATAANAEAMRRLIGALKRAGVRDDDLQTEQVAVWPNAKSDGGVTGYTASSSVRVTVPVDRAGLIVDEATKAGATNVWGPSLTRTETAALEARALRVALDDARRKAGGLAEAADARLGAVVKIVEGGADEPLAYANAYRAAADAETPVEPGTVETRAILTATFVMS